MITMQEIREKTSEDLVKELAVLEGKLREHRFSTSIQQERDTSARSKMRRAIARIKTVLAQRAQDERNQ